MIYTNNIIKAYASAIKDIMNQATISESDKRNVFETVLELRKAADRMDSPYADTLADAEESSMRLVYLPTKKSVVTEKAILVSLMNEILSWEE